MPVKNKVMNKPHFPWQASCSCQANRFEITGEPICRFVCHCEVCQRFTQGPYSDVTVLLSRDVELTDIEHTDFKRYKLPPNIRRGTCTQCHRPSIEFGILDQLVFVPVANYADPGVLPAPSMHIFYHRRVADVGDDLPKHEGFLKSQWAVSQLILGQAAQHLTTNKWGTNE